MNVNPLFANIILPVPLQGIFTYSVPNDLQQNIAVGQRVVVQFGSKKLYTGIVKTLHQNPPQECQIKNILSCLDKHPIINEKQMALWEWISKYYQSNLGEVYKAAIPSGLKPESQTKISLNKKLVQNLKCSKIEQQILDILKHAKEVSISNLNQSLGIKNTLPQMKSLLEKGLILVEEQIRSNYKERQQEFVCLHKKFSESEMENHIKSLKNAKKQTELLHTYLNLSKHYIEDKELKISTKELLDVAKSSRTILKSLVNKKILAFYLEKEHRLDYSQTNCLQPKKLNQHQEKAIAEIRNSFKEKESVLLHGVTSSGKTEIYIHLIQEQLQQGKQVLYLLPEIALTSQIITRLKSHFGNQVGVYHSKFSDAERLETYRDLMTCELGKSYRVILGVRSSVFLPFHNLGLVIVDEEHENTYKQFDPAPRYHARDTALYLSKLHKAKTLLGTATPSVESYYNAKTGKYGLVELFQRHQNIELPKILVVDIKEAKRRKMMKSMFSPELLLSIEESLAKNEQIILFQNRRGYAPYLECKLCSWIPHCTNCSVSLTYHRQKNLLICHYCGSESHPTQNCGYCGANEMYEKGFGTEKIEDKLLSFFPTARVERMDLDATRKKNAYEKLISQFEKQELDILVGTQMVSKGLDFDHVGLVGILNADTMLNYPDFRAYERSFQMMAQVSGRAGRKNKQGKVLIQTHNPNHPIIRFVVNNDYFGMYKNQLQERKTYIYPPFYRLISIDLKHKNQYCLKEATNAFAKDLRNIFGIRVFGPQTPIINRIQGLYIMNILLKIEKKSSMSKVKFLLNQQARLLNKNSKFKSIQIVFNVDPM